MPYSMNQSERNYITAEDIAKEAQQVSGDGSLYAKQIADDFETGKIKNWQVADVMITGMTGKVQSVAGHTHKFFDDPHEAEYLRSDQFHDCPENQQALIVGSLAAGVPLSSLEAMGVTEPMSADKVTSLDENDMIMLSGALRSETMTPEEAKQVLDSIPSVPDNYGEMSIRSMNDQSYHDYVHNAENYVSNSVISNFVDKTHAQVLPENTFARPDTAKRLLSDIGVGDYTNTDPNDLNRLASMPDAFKSEVEPVVNQNRFESYKESSDYKEHLSDLRYDTHGMDSEMHAQCKAVYQAYKNGTIKDFDMASDLMTTVQGKRLEDIGLNSHYGEISNENLKFLTSERFGEYSVEQQDFIIAMMYRGTDLDTLNKMGALENKDPEQFWAFDQRVSAVVDRDTANYNYDEINVVSGALKLGVDPKDIKRTMDNLPYGNEKKEYEVNNYGKEEKIPENYVSDRMSKNVLDMFGYKNPSRTDLKECLQKVGEGIYSALQVRKQLNKNNVRGQVIANEHKARKQNRERTFVRNGQQMGQQRKSYEAQI